MRYIDFFQKSGEIHKGYTGNPVFGNSVGAARDQWSFCCLIAPRLHLRPIRGQLSTSQRVGRKGTAARVSGPVDNLPNRCLAPFCICLSFSHCAAFVW